MRHRIDGKQLGRTGSHRRAMRRNMAAALLQHGAIRTTGPKAKHLRRFVERIITTARKGTLHARRLVISELGDRELYNDDGDPTGQTLVQKLFDEVAPKYVDRPGGYTRIIRLEERRIGDAGSQVILQLVGEESGEGAGGQGASKRKQRAAKRHEAAAATAAAIAKPETEEAVEEAAADDAVEEAPEEKASEEAAEDQASDEQEAEEKK